MQSYPMSASISTATSPSLMVCPCTFGLLTTVPSDAYETIKACLKRHRFMNMGVVSEHEWESRMVDNTGFYSLPLCWSEKSTYFPQLVRKVNLFFQDISQCSSAPINFSQNYAGGKLVLIHVGGVDPATHKTTSQLAVWDEDSQCGTHPYPALQNSLPWSSSS